MLRQPLECVSQPELGLDLRPELHHPPPALRVRDHGMDTQDLEFKFFAKRVESSYVVTATYV